MNTNNFTIQIETLISSILNIRGEKVVTVSIGGQEPFIIDVSAEGVFGHDDTHESLFRHQLEVAFRYDGGLVVRQILPIKTEIQTADGNKTWVPRKLLYGVYIGKGQWFPLSKNEMKIAHCTDPKSGKWIKPGQDIGFRDFPVAKS